MTKLTFRQNSEVLNAAGTPIGIIGNVTEGDQGSFTVASTFGSIVFSMTDIDQSRQDPLMSQIHLTAEASARFVEESEELEAQRSPMRFWTKYGGMEQPELVTEIVRLQQGGWTHRLSIATSLARDLEIEIPVVSPQAPYRYVNESGTE